MNGRSAREGRRQPVDGSSIISPPPDEVRAALDGLSADLPWPELRDRLRPVFIRRRPLPPGMTAPVVRRLPPGLDVALGADIGPAFLYINAPLLEAWAVGEDEAFEIAPQSL